MCNLHKFRPQEGPMQPDGKPSGWHASQTPPVRVSPTMVSLFGPYRLTCHVGMSKLSPTRVLSSPCPVGGVVAPQWAPAASLALKLPGVGPDLRRPPTTVTPTPKRRWFSKTFCQNTRVDEMKFHSLHCPYTPTYTRKYHKAPSKGKPPSHLSVRCH